MQLVSNGAGPGSKHTRSCHCGLRTLSGSSGLLRGSLTKWDSSDLTPPSTRAELALCILQFGLMLELSFEESDVGSVNFENNSTVLCYLPRSNYGSNISIILKAFKVKPRGSSVANSFCCVGCTN